MPVEIDGTLSTFGHQVLSTKPSEPRPKIGTGGRTTVLGDKPFEYLNLCTAAPAIGQNLPGAFGSQPLSKKTTAPKPSFGNRYASDVQMAKEAHPGPGAYQAPEAIGKQVASPHLTEPNMRIGTGTRFSQFKNGFKDDFYVPAGSTWRPASGWLGDSPAYSVHGKARRSHIAEGLAGYVPTPITTPGPGTYEAPSSLGGQTLSRRESVPRARIGTASRESIRKQFMSREHDRDLLSSASPSPSAYTPNLRVTSKVPTTSSWKFGSGDRFSQVKSGNARSLKVLTPGPGTYVI